MYLCMSNSKCLYVFIIMENGSSPVTRAPFTMLLHNVVALATRYIYSKLFFIQNAKFQIQISRKIFNFMFYGVQVIFSASQYLFNATSRLSLGGLEAEIQKFEF